MDNVQNITELKYFQQDGETFPVWHSNIRSQCHQANLKFTSPCVDGTDYKVALIAQDAAGINKKQHSH